MWKKVEVKLWVGANCHTSQAAATLRASCAIWQCNTYVVGADEYVVRLHNPMCCALAQCHLA